jgi:hypothetical protein
VLTLTICLSLLLLACLNAVFSQSPDDWLLPQDANFYLPPFFTRESFYRTLLINITFGGIAVAANGFQFVSYSAFFMWKDPLLAVLLNLGLGVFAAFALSPAPRDLREHPDRQRWVIGLMFGGVVLFIFAIATAVKTETKTETKAGKPAQKAATDGSSMWKANVSATISLAAMTSVQRCS